jgi:flagellar assembly protein FliH
MGASDRFTNHIPRARVGTTESWSPQPLDGRPSVLSREMEARIVAREGIAFQRGREVGFAEAAQIAQQTRQRHVDQVDRVMQSLQGRFAELEGAGADRVLDLALAIAAQVVRREVRRPESLLAAVREAVTAVVDQHAHPRVHVNPQDFEVLRGSIADDGLLGGCRFIADAGVPPSGCRVEVPTGEVDATLETRWRRVLGTLGMHDQPMATLQEAPAEVAMKDVAPAAVASNDAAPPPAASTAP